MGATTVQMGGWGVSVLVGVGVFVDVLVGFGVAVGRRVGVGMFVDVLVGFGVAVGRRVGVGVFVDVLVGFGVAVGRRVGIGAGLMRIYSVVCRRRSTAFRERRDIPRSQSRCALDGR